jgi:hypothetical protein
MPAIVEHAPQPTQVRDLLPPQLFAGTVSALPEDIDAAIANVILGDDEVANLIRNAKIQKYLALRDESIKDIRQRMVAEAKRKWTWKDQWDYLWIRCEEMKIPAAVLSNIIGQDEQAVIALCKYFTNDESFERLGNGYSLQKGIYLHGYVGNGKTTLMRLFARNKKMCFNISRCIDIQKNALNKNYDAQAVVDAMIDNIPEPRDIRMFFQQVVGRCFDDLGTEERPVKVYGTMMNIMEQVLTGRYDHRGDNLPLHSTHVTSNMNPVNPMENGLTWIENEYGSRLYDRFRETYNVIEMKGDSLRG